MDAVFAEQIRKKQIQDALGVRSSDLSRPHHMYVKRIFELEL